MSSGEAEFYGLVKAAGVGLGYKALLQDFGYELPATAWTDSSAAMGVVGRQGLGRLRHLDTHSLRIQHAVRSGRITVRKVKGEDNVADLFTKHLASRERINYLMHLLGCKFAGGRPKAAPERRRERLDRETLGQAVSRGERYPQAKPCVVTEAFGTEDAELQEFVGNLAEAEDVPDGLLPHQVPDFEARHPKLVCKETVEDQEDFSNSDGVNGEDGFFDRIGASIAGEIAREARESGRRRSSSSGISRQK